MSISLKLTTESHFKGTEAYFLHEVRPADGPRVLRVEYECDYLMYLGNGPLPPTPTSWEISGAAADAFEAKLPDAWRDVRELLAYLRASQPELMTGEQE